MERIGFLKEKIFASNGCPVPKLLSGFVTKKTENVFAEKYDTRK